MRKKLLTIVTVLLAFFFAVACSDEIDILDDPDTESKGTGDAGTASGVDKGQRTVLVYVCAQNSLGYSNYLTLDSTEMAKGAQYIGDDDRLIVYFDDDQNPRIYRFANDSSAPTLVRSYDSDLNSSDPETLEEVLTWTMTNYPAEEYGLVMWSHADGWLPSPNTDYRTATRSFGIDVGEDGRMASDTDVNGNIGAGMDIDDMAAVIAATGEKLKFIFFDACLMQCIETAYELRDVAEYVIGSPMMTSAYGSQYTEQIRYGFFSDDPADIARTYYANATGKEYSYMYSSVGAVISAIQTDELEALAALTATLLPQHISDGEEPDMTGVQAYLSYSYSYFYRPEFFDIGSAMQRILGEDDYATWREQLDRAIVYMATTDEYYVGPGYFNYNRPDEYYAAISAFIPQQKYSINASRCLYGDLNEAFRQTAWYEAAGWAATGW